MEEIMTNPTDAATTPQEPQRSDEPLEELAYRMYCEYHGWPAYNGGDAARLSFVSACVHGAPSNRERWMKIAALARASEPTRAPTPPEKLARMQDAKIDALIQAVASTAIALASYDDTDPAEDNAAHEQAIDDLHEYIASVRALAPERT